MFIIDQSRNTLHPHLGHSMPLFTITGLCPIDKTCQLNLANRANLLQENDLHVLRNVFVFMCCSLAFTSTKLFEALLLR